MTSSANTLRVTLSSFNPGPTLFRRSATSLLGAAMLLTLGEAAGAEEQAGTSAGADGADTAALAPAPATPSAPAPAAPSTPAAPAAAAPAAASTEASTAQESATPAGASTPVESQGSVLADNSCDPPASSEVIAPSSLSPEQSRALWPLTWKKSPGQGFSFGLEEGLWGDSWSQGLRVTIPFTRYLGATLRGLYLIEMAGGPFTADAGGRIDLFGRSPVLLNVLRLYGGGGVQVLAPAANTDGRSAQVGVGGHFGFEFFHNPHFSYYLEVGGQGGEPLPGATVVAGMMFYPWTR